MNKMEFKLNSRKQILFAMILLAGIVIILFASSINQLEFSPGVILRDPFENPQPNSGSVNWNEWNLNELWRIVSTIILVVLLPISVVYFILSKEARNRVIRSVVVLTLTVYALFIVIQNLGNIQDIDLFNNLFQAIEPSGDTDQQITALANNEPSLLITIIDHCCPHNRQYGLLVISTRTGSKSTGG